MRSLFVVVSLLLTACGCGAPRFSVKMTDNAESQMFVCGQLSPGELTCLDIETYAARIKANLEEQRHKGDI